MARYIIDGQKVEADDGIPLDDVIKAVKGSSSESVPDQPPQETPQAAPAETPAVAPTETASPPQGEAATSAPAPDVTQPAYTPVQGTITADDLAHNKDWLAASRIIAEKKTGQKWVGSDADLAQDGLNTMGWFNYNLPVMGVEAAKLASAKPEEKKAFLYMMETYDHLGMSWGGTWRAIKGMAFDPTSYVGLASLGLGAVGGKAAQLASKEALKEALKFGVTTAIEGAAQGAAADTMRQTAEINTGGKTDFSYGEMAGSAAIGAGAGAVLGGAVGAGGKLLRKEAPWSRFAKEEAGKVVKGEAPEAAAKDATKAVAGEPVGAPVQLDDVVIPAKPAPAAATPTVIDRKMLTDADGKLDMSKAGDTVSKHVEDALSNGAKVTLHTDGGRKAVPITEVDRGMMKDAQGQRWGVMGLMGDGERIEIEGGTKAAGETLAEAEKPPTPEGSSGSTPSETPAVEPKPNEVMEAIRAVAEDSGVRIFPRTREAVTMATEKATELLSSVKPEDMPQVIEGLRREATTPEEAQLLNNTFKTATDQLEAHAADTYARMMAETDASAKDALFKQLEQVRAVADMVKHGDTVLSSMDGRMLGDRVGSFNTGLNRGVSEETILATKGIKWEEATPAQKRWAANEYYSRYDQWAKKIDSDAKVAEANNAIQKAYDSGDVASALKLTTEKQAIVDKAIADAQVNAGLPARAVNQANKGLKYLNEYIISTVFTTSTVIVNVIPSLIMSVYRPGLDYAMRGPLDYAAYRQMTTTYSVMAHSIGAAWDASRAAFAYEKALLSAEPNRLLEEDAMIKGFKGRAIRFYPRMLGATDEFFGQINYRGYVMGQAMADAIEKGQRLGYEGKQLETYAKAWVEQARNHLFSDKINAPHVIDFLRQKGLDRGMKGPALDKWIETQLDKDEGLFKVATSQAGKDYADDLMFKRKFTGDNWMSKAAQGYESFVNKNPWMRIMGQMFFRTPVRVFEQGMRLTPIVQFASPTLYKDLLGSNGEARQVKAQGEMLLSYAISAWAIQRYAQGKLTSGGPTDYKARRGLENAGYQPNSDRIGGTSFSFRNLDPFSTPLKIWANVLDRLQDLEYRKAQGEFVDHDTAQALAYGSVAVTSVAGAIRDANLVDGANQLYQLGTALMDPEHKDMTIERFLASKVQLAVPNQISKVAQQFAPNMNDPVTISQYIRSRINPADPMVPRQYDALGNVRKNANPMGALVGLQTATEDQLKRGHSPKEMAVLKAVSNLEIASGESFAVAPAKVDKYGLKGIDLRTQYSTKYPNKTLYDRWMELYHATPITNELYSELVLNKSGSVGTRLQTRS